MAKIVLLNPPSPDATPLVVLSQVVGADTESRGEPEVMLRLAPGEGRVETLRPGTCLIVVADTAAGLDYFPADAAPASPASAPLPARSIPAIGGAVLLASDDADPAAG